MSRSENYRPAPTSPDSLKKLFIDARMSRSEKSTRTMPEERTNKVEQMARSSGTKRARSPGTPVISISPPPVTLEDFDNYLAERMAAYIEDMEEENERNRKR